MSYLSRKETRRFALAHAIGCKSDQLEYLGSGNFADAYEYKGRVYKVTDDPDDYIMATKMIKIGHKYPNFVKVYKTALIDIQHDEGWVENLYMIVSEKVTPIVNGCKIVKDIWEDLEDVNSSYRCIEEGLPARSTPRMVEAWTKEGHLELLNTLLSQMDYCYKLYKSMGLKTWDNHCRNIGFVDGIIKIFDMGYSIRTKKNYSKRRKIVYSLQINSECL